jgi:hypothetical protein
MERDGQLELYDLVAARLKDAHRAVRGSQVSDDTRRALTSRLERLMEDVEAGRPPSDPPGEPGDGTP